MDIWWKCFFYFISGEELAFSSHFSLKHPWANLSSNKMDSIHFFKAFELKWKIQTLHTDPDPYLCTHVEVLFHSILSHTHSRTVLCVYRIYSLPLCHNSPFPLRTTMNTGPGPPEYNFQLEDLEEKMAMNIRFCTFFWCKRQSFCLHNSSVPTCLTELQAALEKWACVCFDIGVFCITNYKNLPFWQDHFVSLNTNKCMAPDVGIHRQTVKGEGVCTILNKGYDRHYIATGGENKQCHSFNLCPKPITDLLLSRGFLCFISLWV